MSIQQRFDQEALDLCPEIKKLIYSAERAEANQMLCCFLRRCMDCTPALVEMSDEQKSSFQAALTSEFIYKEWV
jgi:hypothetical protein